MIPSPCTSLTAPPVTFTKVYEPVLIVSNYEAYRFDNNERLAAFCNKHHISPHPTITLG